ncbi:MAG: metallophosphoesterase family protein [Actinomycetota bacterium]
MVEEPRRPRVRSVLALIGPVLAGAAAAALALPLAPAVHHPVGPATVAASASVGAGRTVVTVPPLGTVAADTHTAPLTIGLTLFRVDFTALGRVVSDPSQRADLVANVEHDLRALGRRVTLQLLLSGAVIGAIAGALLPRVRWTHAAEGAVGGLLLVGAGMIASAVTFDTDAFAEPRFTGELRRAPVVIEAVQEGNISLAALRGRFETAADRLSELMLLLAKPNPDPRTDTTAVLHVSDIHSNPIGMEIAVQLARRFRVDAVIDTGDLMSFGLPLENAIASLVENVDVPYYFVPGNHDSADARRAAGRVEGVTVLLDGDIAEVRGIEILGWDDPTYTVWDQIPTEEGNEIRLEVGETVAQEVEASVPDVLAVHDSRLAEASFGLVPLVLAGHDHVGDITEEEGTTVLQVGSTGATGLGAFTVEADHDYEAEIVYFRDQRAVAVDYVSFSGLGSDFEVDRTTLVAEEDEDEEEE